jgi:AcrR family transcriptional regulator
MPSPSGVFRHSKVPLAMRDFSQALILSRNTLKLRDITCRTERVHFLLDRSTRHCDDLNMFKSLEIPPAAGKSAGQTTKELILEQALELFRKRGFEAAAMRDIARAANVATGAAYYYFASKEAMVSAYYEQVQRLHAAKARDKLARTEKLGERLAIVMHSKLEILQEDRKFLGALFRYTGEPGHPLSVFGKGTKIQRKQSVGIFREALDGSELAGEWKELLPWGLWLAHLGMILYFIHDESEGQAKTHKLVDRFVEILAGVVALANSALVRPFVKPFQEKIVRMLREAGWSEGV